MNGDRWRRVNELFHAAREMHESLREDFVRGACGDDEALLSEVRGMLRADARSGMLDGPPVTPPSSRFVFFPGQLVSGRYRIVRFLGRGGMGEVFEADDCELKEPVALKTLLAPIASDTGMLARFKQEIQLARKVSHPNVCRVFDLARHPADAAASEATVFLTMEFLDGETLSSRIRRRGRLSPAEVLPLLAQMAEALDAAHRAGVVHRDFKPSNVMLVGYGEGLRAVVTDFGLARAFFANDDATATLTGAIVGTPAYMAPELMLGAKASIASDVYAFGLTAYQMITGALPFAEGDGAGFIRRTKGPAPSPRDLIPDLDAKWEVAIQRALDPDPERRFSRAGHMVKALKGEAPSVSIRVPAMTRRRAIGGVAAAVVVAAGLTGWEIWARLRNQPSADGLKWYQTGAAALRDATYYRAARALERAVSIDPGFALAHARLAEAWNELDDSERAKEEMLRALAGQSSHPASRAADGLYIDAIQHTLMGDFPAAIRTYQAILGKVPAAEVAQVLVDLGRAQQGNGEPSKALESYRSARQRDPNNAAAHLRTGIVLARSGEVREASSEFDQADSLYQSLSNTEGQTEVLYQRGVLASTTAALPQARAALEKAVQLSKATSAEYQEIASTLQLSVVTYQEGDVAEAERLAIGATQRARDSGMANLAARGLTDLGNAQFLKADFTRAETVLQQALALARRYRLRRYEARALLSLANLHQQQGAAEATLKEAESALAFYRPAGFRGETISCLTLIARANRDNGRYEEALRAFEQQRSLAEGAGDQKQMAFAEQGIASVLARQERWPEALTRYQRYYDIASSIRSRDGIGRALLGEADVLWRLGRHEEASKALNETEKLTGPSGSAGQLPSLIAASRAAIAFSRGLYRESSEWARRTTAMASTTGQVRALANCVGGLALVRAGSISEGRRLCAAGFDAAAALGDRFVVLEDQLSMAEILLAGGEAHSAEESARKALEDFERTGRKESAWRAWAIVALSRRRLADLASAKKAAQTASDRLMELRAQWGADAFDGYIQRPDLRTLRQGIKP